MIKFFRKIRQNLLSEGRTGKYFKYALGEILLVVLGILIALQINNWNGERIPVDRVTACRVTACRVTACRVTACTPCTPNVLIYSKLRKLLDLN